MRPFVYRRASVSPTLRPAAVQAAARRPMAAQFLAGGTTLLDLMKLDVMRPDVADRHQSARRFRPRQASSATPTACGSARWCEWPMPPSTPTSAATFPVIAQSLELAASAQLRNMATLGGNVLQRTRCTYFRDAS